ncbi:hypothetical protein DWF00_19720 [Bosea caraganae]|uniref:Uncharacterized protein n=1 Tax=Bosea caraganae TaxID=2763117 RepID=A0A370KXL9_9HYPH|nr:hypothetical protein DWE98_28485 [Bosea caraganae]RDJ24354.1 hypothetical protein DWF00_19720 [Bosea caraganae]
MVFTAHRPDHALAVTDRALLMVEGDRYLIGELANVMTEASLAALYHLPVRMIGDEEAVIELPPQYAVVADYGLAVAKEADVAARALARFVRTSEGWPFLENNGFMPPSSRT